MAIYSYPRSFAASAISAIVPDPSLQRVCICKSPRRFFAHASFLASSCFASASEVKSWRIGGIFVLNGGGLSSHRRICFSMNGPIPRSSVNERFWAARSVTFSGHKNALRAARRKARDRIPASPSACLASSSAMSVFDNTSENRFGLRLQGRLNRS
jgi:hypothetical protein